MPGNAGMVPSHNNRSVPVLMPLNSTSTLTSAAPISGNDKPVKANDLGCWKTIAVDCMTVYLLLQ